MDQVSTLQWIRKKCHENEYEMPETEAMGFMKYFRWVLNLETTYDCPDSEKGWIT